MKKTIFTSKGLHAIRAFAVFALLCFFIAYPTSAQDNPMLFKKIQLPEKSYTFDELTHEIHKQTGITFSYNASQVNPHQRFRIKAEQMNVTQLLSFIQKHSGIGYKIINRDYIVYMPQDRPGHPNIEKTKVKKKKGSTAKKKEPKKGTTKTAIHEETVLAASNPVQQDSTGQRTEVVIGDSITVSDFFTAAAENDNTDSSNNDGSKPVRLVMRYSHKNVRGMTDVHSSLDPPADKRPYRRQRLSFDNPDILGFLEKNILIAGGISVDETYYFNPGLRFGFRFLYTTLSYNLGAFPEWRYGLGAEVPLSEKWLLQLEFNTGKAFFKDYTYPTVDTVFFPPEDSIPPLVVLNDIPVNVVSKLSSFSVAVATHLNRNILLAGGLTINRLRSSYFSEGLPFDINSIDPEIPNATDHFRTLKPPYILSQSYNAANASGVQYWLGVRLSVYWRLN